MKTQPVLVIILGILSISILLFSATVWQNRIKDAGGVVEDVPPTYEEQGVPSIENETDKKQIVSPLGAEDIRKIGSSLDKTTLDVLLTRAEAGESVQMLLIGSDALSNVGKRLTLAMDKAYSGLVTVDVATFDTTSSGFVEQQLDSDASIDWQKGYDIVLYEPFTLHNNGIVIIEKEHKDLLEVKAYAESIVNDASFLVTPPQPIYQAKFYLTQVKALEKFTTARGIPYIAHWQNWPDTQSADIQNYLDDDSIPTERGIEMWSDALIAYFTGEQ